MITDRILITSLAFKKLKEYNRLRYLTFKMFAPLTDNSAAVTHQALSNSTEKGRSRCYGFPNGVTLLCAPCSSSSKQKTDNRTDERNENEMSGAEGEELVLLN